MVWIKYLFCRHRHGSKMLQCRSVKSSLSFFSALQLKSVYFRWFDWNFRWFLMFFTLVLMEEGQTEWTVVLWVSICFDHVKLQEIKWISQILILHAPKTHISNILSSSQVVDQTLKSQQSRIKNNNNDNKLIIFASILWKMLLLSVQTNRDMNRDGLFLPELGGTDIWRVYTGGSDPEREAGPTVNNQ